LYNNKKRYRCTHCGKRGISEEYESIDTYARKTNRYDQHIANETTTKDHSRVAKENDLSYTAVEKAVSQQIDPIIEKRTKDLDDEHVLCLFGQVLKHVMEDR
jgi:transposase